MILRCLVCILTCFSFAAAALAEWEVLPDIEPMSDMNLSWVAKNIRYNGLPMSIRTFDIEESAEDVLAYYERDWKVKIDSRVSRSKNKDYDVLGSKRGRYYYSVQVKAVGKRQSIGTLTVSVAPDEIKEHELNNTDFPTPGNADLLNRIESNDSGLIAENLMLRSTWSQDYLLDWFGSRLLEEGWRVITHRVDPDGEHGQLQMQKGAQNAQIVVTNDTMIPNSEFNIVQINWVKESEVQ